jgi:hypothetical protein
MGYGLPAHGALVRIQAAHAKVAMRPFRSRSGPPPQPSAARFLRRLVS